MSLKEYNFSVPIKGYEHFSVKANSYEEALEKINNCEYECEPTLDDIDWDFGFRGAEEELPSCYTVQEIDE